MKLNPFAGKSTRTKIFTVITLVAVVLLIFLNLFLASFTIYGNAYIDLTPEGLYTLRDVMVEACQEILNDADGNPIDPGITVTFCDARDNLIDNYLTRVVYFMTVAMSKEFSNFSVEIADVDIDPNSVAKYKTTSLTQIGSTDIIVSCGQRYRILSAEDFWHIGSETVVSYDGEYKLASVMMSLTMVNRPVAYFVTNHGESYYDPDDLEDAHHKGSVELASFADLLGERGFAIKTLDLSAVAAEENPKIPDDCVLLIINNPTTDFSADATKEDFNSFYYVSETELLDRYMADDRGSIIVAKDYKVTLPNLEAFLSEWGIGFGNALVKDDQNYIENDEGEITTLIADYSTDKDSYGYSIYGDFVDLASAPIAVVSETGYIYCSFGDSDAKNEPGSFSTSRIYAPFLFSSSASQCYEYNEISGEYNAVASDPSSLPIAAVAGRKTTDGSSGNQSFSYIFCAASASYFSNELIGNSSYSNYEINSALIQHIARLESYADDSLGGLNVNNKESFLGKMLVETAISEEDKDIYEWDAEAKRNVLVKTIYGLPTWAKVIYTIVVALNPIAIAIVGIVVCTKRKYL